MKAMIGSAMFLLTCCCVFSTLAQNDFLQEANDDFRGKCVRVPGWILPAEILEVRWHSDDPAPIRAVMRALNDRDSNAVVTLVRSTIDDEDTVLRWMDKSIHTVSCR